MTNFLLAIQRPLAALLPLLIYCLLLVASPLLGQCDLSGNYNNNQFQDAIDAAANAPNNCTTITLTGTASWPGGITIPPSVFFVIGGTATINGNGSITSTNDIEILAGGTFNTNNNDITINGTLINNLGSLMGPISGILASLPVELLSFNANRVSGGVDLRWKTATETNNEVFELERSQDARVFSTITRIAGVGTTNEQQDYQYLDRSPAIGSNYYRLKQIDYDGTFAYSDVVVVVQNNSAAADKPSLFPNPATAGTRVQLLLPEASESSSLVLRDANGRSLSTTYTLSAGGLQFSLPAGLANGLYYVSLVNASGIYTQLLFVH